MPYISVQKRGINVGRWGRSLYRVVRKSSFFSTWFQHEIGRYIIWQDQLHQYLILCHPNKPISQIPQCIRQIYAGFNKNVHISVTKKHIVGYRTSALWDVRLVHCGIVNLVHTLHSVAFNVVAATIGVLVTPMDILVRRVFGDKG